MEANAGSVPQIVSWNLTKRCNLKCAHCYLDATELEGTDHLDTARALAITEEIAALSPSAMLVLTGGEPLLRDDILEICSHASALGLAVVLGTNGLLLDDERAAKLKAAGLFGAGVSLDSTTPAYHDRLRGLEGSWSAATLSMEALAKNAVPFQVQFTATKDNYKEVPAIIELAEERGALAVNIFFLVCTGRGREDSDIGPEEYEETLKYLAGAEREYAGRIMVRARCAPHFLRVVAEREPESPLLRGDTSGCIAATSYLRITPEGMVTPCPYIPPDQNSDELGGGVTLGDIWKSSPVFSTLRNPSYEGKCSRCGYKDICGGCRARALASGKGLMGEDSWCAYEPEDNEADFIPAEAVEPEWSKEAGERLGRAPGFLRPMIKKGVEHYARAHGIALITPALMAGLREKAGR